MLKVYQDAWLKGDSSTILSLFDDSAVLMPNGMEPVIGKKAMIGFWWPGDSSKTTIDNYNIKVKEVNGGGNWAYAMEEGILMWNYTKGYTMFSKKQRSFEISVFHKIINQWKIIRRIWTDIEIK